MEVEHFSHPDHPLILINQVLEYNGEEVICSGCEEPISGPCYSCISCYFFLHKKCAELPQQIKRRIHPKHPLNLLAKPPPHYTRCHCDLCYKTCKSFVYHCSLCKFDLDIKCAFQPCFFEFDSHAHQFAHIDHPLILNEEQEFHGEGVMCSGCEEPMSGPSYSCTSCNFFLHKKCAELPQEIKRHLHPAHPLLLLPKPPPYYNESGSDCNLCNKTCKSFVYYCSICKFRLDIKCALPTCISEVEGQGHHFICLIDTLALKSFSFTCNACGTDGDDSPYMCSMCQLIVHKACISLPRTIKLLMHQHPQIIHTYHLQRCNSINKYCGICRLGVDTDYGVYYCPDCDFVAHVNCGIAYQGSDTESEEEERSIAMIDEFKESSFCIVYEIKHGEENIIAEIKHFSHQHNLILIDEVNDDLKCDGCMFPIFTPFYSCAECNFFLDKICIGLPREKKWQYHRHPLILISNAWEDPFECTACGQYCHGFGYNCDRCDFCIDVRCFKSLKDSIKHGGHEHSLFLAGESENHHCSGCDVTGKSETFRCNVCDFNLDFKCATLPHKVRHRYDEHPLFLTYIDPNDYQFVCQICEKERDPKLWFYRCEECDFDAHPSCVLGKNPYIKLGGCHTYGIHTHPLTLVEKTEDYPACHTCGEPCDDLALECTHSRCSFIIHWKRRCMNP